MARYTYGRDHALPIGAGGRLVLAWPLSEEKAFYGDMALRAGNTDGGLLLHGRSEGGYRRLYQARQRTRPFLELGFGVEAVRLGSLAHDRDVDIGPGPSVGLGWLLGEEERGVFGARITGALVPGGYETDSDDFDNDVFYGFRYLPTNLTLALNGGVAF